MILNENNVWIVMLFVVVAVACVAKFLGIWPAVIGIAAAWVIVETYRV